MGSFCSSPTTVNQSQTYRPNPAASEAITGALNQAQGVAQTPFQTPVAPVAGFSQDQGQAFQNTRNAQGWAQPYLDQAQDYFSGNRVGQFYNPFASNVMAGLKDVFGEQQQQTTGKLQQLQGGVGGDRIAVGQANLAKQQGLAAGQTLSGLYRDALSASQNAGFGIGALGPVAQNAQLQGAQALLGTGGLQQQLQQAQMNAPYQNQLARIQWPYQNAQFNASVTGALTPGLGGTTAGNTTYPQQSPWGTIAGLGMAGAGLYGAGTQQGWWGGGGSNDMASLPMNYTSPAYDATTNTINPNYTAARGGRINPYADGGAVEGGSEDDISDKIHSAEINQLLAAGSAPVGNPQGQPQAGVRPINVAAQSLIPTGQIPAIQPHIPQLQAPQQQSGGSGGGMGDMVKMAATVLPLLLNRGGRVGYAEGGAANPFDPSDWGRPEPVPEGQGFWEGFWRDAAKYAPLALRAGAVRLHPPLSAAGNSRLQLRGRFTRHTDAPRWAEPSVMNSPLAAGAAGAGQALGATSNISPPFPRHVSADSPQMRQSDAMGDVEGQIPMHAPQGDSFAVRFGGLAPPSEPHAQAPLFMQSGQHEMPPASQGVVPLPRSNPFVPFAMAYEAKKRAAVAPARAPEREISPAYRPLHMADGGEVDELEAPAEPFITRRQAALSEANPFEIAAMRQREAVRPTGGRQDGPMLGAAGTALALAGGPEALMARYAPRAGAALYGLAAGAAPTEAGEQDFKWSDPNADRAKRLSAIDEAIALESSRKTPSAPGTQKARIDSLAREKEQLLGSRGEDYNLARSAWQSEQDQAREALLEKKRQETSLFDKVPGTRAALTAASPFASYFGGKYLGKRLSPYAAIPIGGAAGALEGAASIAGPTEMDINSLPKSSPARQEAQSNLSDPEYWKRVGLAAGVSGTFGALGANKGYASTKPVRTPAMTAATANLPEAAQKAVQIAKPKAKIVEVQLPDGSTAQKYDYGNRVMWRQNGKIIKAPNTKPLPPPTTQPPMQMQAAGGAVHANPYFADGGDTESWADVIARQNGVENPIRRMTEGDLYGADYQTAPAGKFPRSQSPNPPVPPDLDYEHNAFKPTQEAYGRKLSGDMVGSAPAQEVERQQARMLRDDSEDDAFSANASAAPAVNPFMPSQAGAAPAGKQSLVDSPWMALINAGLGTMASAGQRDARGLPMSPLAAIGHGGQQGIQTLQHQQTAAQKQQSIEMAAKRLDAEAARHMRAMTETERHNKATEARQTEQLGRQWKVIGPSEDGNGTLMFNEKTGETRVSAVKMGQKPGKPLPSGMQKDLQKNATTFERLSYLTDTFKPSYAGDVSDTVGNAKNWLGRHTGLAYKDRAEWWQQHQRYTNVVRHELFGAALTKNEMDQWNKADVSPGMRPDVIQENLKRQKEIIDGAIRRTALSLKQLGFDQKAIEYQIGRLFGELGGNEKKEEAKPAAEALPKAAPKASMSPEKIKAALEWAAKNPDTPQGKQILQQYGRP